MKPIFALFFLCSIVSIPLTSHPYSTEELGEKLFAVHATDVFPADGVAKAGFELDENAPKEIPNFRCTIHFALGELVRPLGDDWMSWEDKKYAVVTPLKQLYPQLVNLNCYDTFILGDYVLDEEAVLIAPKGTKVDGISVTIFEYDSDSTLREAVDTLIASKGGWKVTMLSEDLEDKYPPAIWNGVNINTPDSFQPILEELPHLSLGLRFDPHHGEAWRFSNTEMTLLGLYYCFYDSPDLFTAEDLEEARLILLENHQIFTDTYLEAPMLHNKSKTALLEKLIIVDQWIQMINEHLECSLDQCFN